MKLLRYAAEGIVFGLILYFAVVGWAFLFTVLHLPMFRG